MANKVSDLTALAAGSLDTAADYVYVVDTSAGTSGSKKMTPDALLTARTFPTSVKLADSATLILGTGDDITVAWDGTDLDVLQAGTNSSIKWGVDGAGMDQVWYGDTASTSMTWDQSADALVFADNAKVVLGTGSDITAAWDGTDLDILQAGTNSSIKWGVDGAGMDQVWYGDTASTSMTWDQSADSLIFADNAKVVLGTGSDITLAWDGTDLDILQAAANSSVKWGVDGAGLDQVWYGDTASTNMTWDQSADSLIFNGAVDVSFVGTTGQPELTLTDDLADALSIKVAGGADLIVFTTTNSSEQVTVPNTFAAGSDATDRVAIKGIYMTPANVAVAVPTIADAEIDEVAVDVSAALSMAPAVGDAVIAMPQEALMTDAVLCGAWVSATDTITVSFAAKEGGAGVTGANINFKFLVIDLT